MYYEDKIVSLKRIFGTSDVVLTADSVRVGATSYPIIDDVIVVSPPDRQTDFTRRRLDRGAGTGDAPRGAFAEDVQYSFGEEWKTYGSILPEHRAEFEQYFDVVDLASLADRCVCDLGCGSGRWSFFLKDHCRELVLVDFSDAIFVARRNLAGASHCLFFQGDLTQLPFGGQCADLLICLGVLHHLPVPCIEEVRRLRRYARRLLIFLYYALDNRPIHFRVLLALVTRVRRALAHVRHPAPRRIFSLFGAYFVYLPLIVLGRILRPLGLGGIVPLHDFYRGKSMQRIEQDVYDRFFTRIEQRVTRAEIRALEDSFARVTVSDGLPYWHFLCESGDVEEPASSFVLASPGP